ncbi:Hint domain-containing protein [Paracoccus fontiphilus]|uniref:Hint domain-containing protein n=1 Tax=Paracoccus fontiphilus TaxID=1815556 RepID=A0ABV7IEB1_9RHOB|nr:Hint domain-containing protein [Paracoccus fontiphilus]
MPYVTQLPPNVLNVGVDGSIVAVPSARLVNFFGPSTEFDGYEQPTPDNTLQPGDTTNLSQDDPAGTDVLADATYRGTAEIDAVSAGVDVPFVAQITLDVLPRTVDIFSTTAGSPPTTTTYMVTDTPFDQQNIEVTATIQLLSGAPLTVTAPISGIVAAITGASPLLAGAGGLLTPAVNGLVNTAALTVQTDTTVPKTIPPSQVLCFGRGTLIETDRGRVAVEDLRVGDMVVTRDNGLQPIRIRAGALGANSPSADLIVSPQHRVLVRSKVAVKMFGADEILVAAKQLLNLDGIDIAEDLAEVEYFHFMFDDHQVVLSNGAETESLFTGPEALKSVGHAARREILDLFPDLAELDYEPVPARMIPSGRKARKLVMRHLQNGRVLVS